MILGPGVVLGDGCRENRSKPPGQVDKFLAMGYTETRGPSVEMPGLDDAELWAKIKMKCSN